MLRKVPDDLFEDLVAAATLYRNSIDKENTQVITEGMREATRRYNLLGRQYPELNSEGLKNLWPLATSQEKVHRFIGPYFSNKSTELLIAGKLREINDALSSLREDLAQLDVSFETLTSTS